MTSRPRDTEIRRIGRQLRLLREKSGRTLAQLAQAADLSERAIRDLEAGRTNPSLATVVSITDVLGVTLDELVGAARRNAPILDFTPAAEANETSAELTRRLPEPRMRARILRFDGKPAADVPAGAVFGHVLDGDVAVLLDGEESSLRQGDSFHAQAAVLGGWRAIASGGRLLVVEAVAADGAEGSAERQEGE